MTHGMVQQSNNATLVSDENALLTALKHSQSINNFRIPHMN